METTLFDSQELDSLVVTDSSLNNKYSQKVHSPIYTPRNINREGVIWECYNSSKYDRLINIINASNVTKEQKKLLCLSATRFIEFNYEAIADYYCSCDKEMQKLMEMLAMVIIDFDSAIENGFIELNDKMRALYEREKNSSTK